MAWRTGFLRLWIILSVLWCAAWILANNTVQKAIDFAASDYLSTSMTAGDVRLERIEGGVATVTVPIEERNSWIGESWWMESRRTFEFFTSGVSPDRPDEWNRLLEAAASEFNKDGALHNSTVRRKRAELMQEVTIAVVLPLMMLVLGWSVGWIISGFRVRPK